MGHCTRHRSMCKTHLTGVNQHKKLHKVAKIAFCGQVKAFPVGHRHCH